MPVVDTVQTFNTGDTVTSTTLNNIMDQSVFVAGAVVSGSGLAITAGGQMTTSNIPGANITSGTITGGVGGSIANDTITDLNVSSTAAISPSKLGSGALTATATVTTSNIVDASITAPKLSGAQTGTAPIFGVRAWVAYDPDTPISPEFSGTYSRSGTTVTVIAAGHGLKTGSLVYLNFTSGAATDGEFIITSVSTTTVTNDTFTITHGTSGSTSGNVGIPRATITGSGNVSSVTLISEGKQVVNFTTEMPNTNYAAVGSPSDFASTANNAACDIMAKYIGGCQIRMQNGGGSDFSHPTNVMVIG